MEGKLHQPGDHYSTLWARMTLTWAVLYSTSSILGLLGGILALTWGVLRPYWGQLGPTSGHVEGNLRHPGTNLNSIRIGMGRLCSSLGQLGPIWRRYWHPIEVSWIIRSSNSPKFHQKSIKFHEDSIKPVYEHSSLRKGLMDSNWIEVLAMDQRIHLSLHTQQDHSTRR